MSEWPSDPRYNWSKHFSAGDFVRLADGRPATVRAVDDCAAEPPPRWELIVSAPDTNGNPDTFIVDPWDCRPDPTAGQELTDKGIT